MDPTVPVLCWTVKCGLTLYSSILDEPDIQETLVTQLYSYIYNSKTIFIPKINQIFPSLIQPPYIRKRYIN